MRAPSRLRVTLLALQIAAPAACRRAEPPPRPDAHAAAPRPAPRPQRPKAPPPRPAAEPPLPEGATRIALLHSRGIAGEYEAHPNGGLARRATFTARMRSEVGAVLQVDAGDLLVPAPPDAAAGLVPPDPAEVDRRARLLLEGLRRIRLDAFTPGESDLALGIPRLRRLLAAARIPAVASNLVDAAGRPVFAADRLVETAGVRVGIFGILAAQGPIEGAVLRPAEETARAAVAGLRARGARMVVALLHLDGGEEAARALVAAAPGIDVAVLGHGAAGGPASVRAGGTLLVASATRGRSLGEVQLGVAADGVHARAGAVLLDRSVASDPAMAALVRRYVAESRRRHGKKLPVGVAALPPWSAPAGKAGPPPPAPLETWTYGSTGACALCHREETEQWQTTSHAYALATLERKGRQRDPACLGCHTVGFMVEGGTRNLETATTYFANVGCESCHGPSVAHVRAQNKTGTTRAVPPEVCLRCHSPLQSDEPFDYPSALREVLGPGHGLAP